MSLPPFQIIRNQELPDLARVQDNITGSLLPVWAAPFMNGKQLTDVVLSATALDVAHGLGRQWVGVLVLKQSAGQTIYQPSSTANKAAFVTLKATGAVTATLWVF